MEKVIYISTYFWVGEKMIGDKVNFLSGREPDYSIYKLKENPFPSIEIPNTNVDILADRDEVVERIFEVAKNSWRTGNSSIFLIKGEYGSGKTHILKYFEDKINEQLLRLPKDRGIAIYTVAGKSFMQFYKNIIINFGNDSFTRLANELIEKVLEKNPDKDIEKKLINSNLDKEDIEKLFKLLLQINELKDVSSNFLRSFLNLKTERWSAWRYLRGETLTASERTSLGVIASMKEEEATEAFISLKKILKFLGFKTIFILLDELEKAQEILSEQKKYEYYDNLRHFIDVNPTGMCLIMAIHDVAMIEIERTAHPLERRLRRNSEMLDPFIDEEVMELIEIYLKIEREKFFKYRKEEENLDITYEEFLESIEEEYPRFNSKRFPFSDSFIREINKRANGLVSEIIRIVGKLIDKNYKKNILFEDPEKLDELLGEKSRE